MPFIGSFYTQRDTRLVDVTLTGSLTNNGILANGNTRAAVASIDIYIGKHFMVDISGLQIRASEGGSDPTKYLVGVVFTNVSPPRFVAGFEVNIIFNVKNTNGPPKYPMLFRIQKNPAVALDYGNEQTYLELDNVDYANTTDTITMYTYGLRTVTLLSTGTYWVVKSTYLNNGLKI